MTHKIDFAHEFHYRDLPAIPFVPAVGVTLIGPSGQDEFVAIVDTGAAYCLFNGRRAKSIGLDLQAGRQQKLAGIAGGTLMARIHQVRLEILGSTFKCEVAFSEEDIGRELLGRHDLFSQVRFGFREGRSIAYFHPSP